MKFGIWASFEKKIGIKIFFPPTFQFLRALSPKSLIHIPARCTGVSSTYLLSQESFC